MMVVRTTETDALVSCLKNNIKIYIKIYYETVLYVNSYKYGVDAN